MQINALVDMLQMLTPGIESFGEEHPDLEITTREELLQILAVAEFRLPSPLWIIAREYTEELAKILST